MGRKDVLLYLVAIEEGGSLGDSRLGPPARDLEGNQLWFHQVLVGVVEGAAGFEEGSSLASRGLETGELQELPFP